MGYVSETKDVINRREGHRLDRGCGRYVPALLLPFPFSCAWSPGRTLRLDRGYSFVQTDRRCGWHVFSRGLGSLSKAVFVQGDELHAMTISQGDHFRLIDDDCLIRFDG